MFVKNNLYKFSAIHFPTQITKILNSKWMLKYKIKYLFMFLFISRYNDGTVKLRNPNIELMDQDILYHLALGSGSHDLQEMFGDVKVILRIKC